jgi:DDE superfamily endonuclease
MLRRSHGPPGACAARLRLEAIPVRPGPGPRAREKRRIRREIRALPERSVVLAEDETDLLLFPPLRGAWSKRGVPAEVRLSARNAKRVIFGATSLRTGHRLLVPRPRGRSNDFQPFLAAVRRDYWGWNVALLLDEDSCHTAKASRQAAEGITLLWLPNRAPELNPMDTLRGQAKDVISANRQHESIDDQVQRFVAHIDRMANREALHTSGVHSKNFWLRDGLSKNL